MNGVERALRFFTILQPRLNGFALASGNLIKSRGIDEKQIFAIAKKTLQKCCD